MGTNTEYTGPNGQVGTSVIIQTALTDTSPGPSKAPSTGTVLAEVSKEITNPVANGYYPVYVDLPRGHAGLAQLRNDRHRSGAVRVLLQPRR